MRYFTNALLVFAGVMWVSTFAIAATTIAVAQQSPASAIVIDWVLFAFSALLSTMSGAAALAWRLNGIVNALGTPAAATQIPRPWLFGTAHMLGSWLAGILAYLTARTATTWDVYAVLLSVGFASFGGARGLEIATERYLNGGKPFPKDPP